MGSAWSSEICLSKLTYWPRLLFVLYPYKSFCFVGIPPTNDTLSDYIRAKSLPFDNFLPSIAIQDSAPSVTPLFISNHRVKILLPHFYSDFKLLFFTQLQATLDFAMPHACVTSYHTRSFWPLFAIDYCMQSPHRSLLPVSISAGKPIAVPPDIRLRWLVSLSFVH